MSLKEQFKVLEQDLNASLVYYGALWTRCRCWLWASRLTDFCAAALAGVAFAKDDTWMCWIAIGIAAASWLKTESFVDRRVGVLAKQYQQVDHLIRLLPAESAYNEETLKSIKDALATVEEGDLPTIRCLWAVCVNEALIKSVGHERWKLTWWERWIGTHFRFMRYKQKDMWERRRTKRACDRG